MSRVLTQRRAQLPRDKETGQLSQFAWPGGYEIAYYCPDGERLCFECARQADADEFFGDGCDWAPSMYDIDWEGPPETCTNCNKEIPSEYGEDE